MKKYSWIAYLSIILFIGACNTNYSVDLKIRNNSGKKVFITYIQKDNNQKVVRPLVQGETFAISKYDRPGNDLEWKTIWKYNIKSVISFDSIESWKDYNVEGAWDHENLTNKTKSVLVIAQEDFAK
jgi:hypothetical protein